MLRALTRKAALPHPTRLAALARAAQTNTTSTPPPSASYRRHISSHFQRADTPLNPGIVVVPQQSAWVVERFRRFDRVLEPGLHFLIPFVHRISYVFSLKEETVNVPAQTAVTRDNVSVHVDALLFIKIVDAQKAAYGVGDPHFAVAQLAQTTMRSEVGKLALDVLFAERSNLNAAIVESINEAASEWGIQCIRYEIRDITPPRTIQNAMEMQAEAERRRRALILDSEGEREAEVNIAEGKKQSRVLASEAEREEMINLGRGEAMAVRERAAAAAAAASLLGRALQAEGGREAVSTRLAEQYISAFAGLAKTGNTLVLPSDAGNVGAMVAQATGVFKTILAGGGAEAAAAADAPAAPEASKPQSADASGSASSEAGVSSDTSVSSGADSTE